MADEKLSSVLVQTYFSIKDGDDETVATLRSEMRHGVRFINSIWVSPKHRKQGHGKSLMVAALKEFGTQDLYLHVHGFTNEPLADHQLIYWYESFGFIMIQGAYGMMKRPASVYVER